MKKKEITVGWKVKQVRFLESGEVVVDFADDAPSARLDYLAWSDLALPREEAITSEQHAQLEAAVWRWTVRERALALLASREHSRWELRQKLRQRFDAPELIDTCLDDLQERGYQSDDRFARSFLESRLHSRDQGPFRLVGELQQRGISRELAERLLGQHQSPSLWLEKARRARDKALKRLKPGQPQHNLWNKLYQQGFSRDIIEQVMGELPDDADARFS